MKLKITLSNAVTIGNSINSVIQKTQRGETMLNFWKTLNAREKAIHLILYFIGVGVMPAGVVLTINAHMGAGGYDALNFVLADILGIKTSYAIYGTAFFILLMAALFRKSYPRIETFISSFFMGIFTDLWKRLFDNIQGTTFTYALILMILGIIIIAFSVACYMISIFPTNPSDDFIVALNERGIKIGIAKISFDVICVILAFILGGEIGVGTIIITIFLGPVIDIFHGFLKKILK